MEYLGRYISTFLAVTHQLLCSTYCSTYVPLLLISTQLVENSPKHCNLHCVLAVANQKFFINQIVVLFANVLTPPTYHWWLECIQDLDFRFKGTTFITVNFWLHTPILYFLNAQIRIPNPSIMLWPKLNLVSMCKPKFKPWIDYSYSRPVSKYYRKGAI